MLATPTLAEQPASTASAPAHRVDGSEPLAATRPTTNSPATQQSRQTASTQPTTEPASPPTSQPGPLAFSVTYDESVLKGPYTGRVWIITTTGRREPRFGPDWFDPKPFATVDVHDWKAGEPLLIRGTADAYPTRIADWPARDYRVQAVMDLAGDGRTTPGAAGNGYSGVVRLRPPLASAGQVDLRIARRAPAPRLISDSRVRLVEFVSPMLSRFYGHEVKMRAAVCLPENYDESPNVRYATVYDVPGFGADYRFVMFYRRNPPKTDPPLVYVVLDPNCPLGHHAFADSASNGPRGAALVQEFIPHLERQFRLVADASGRFLTGVSSGGWSSLWLQVNYPDTFNGTWSLAPDPVDFRDFCGVDLYAADANVYYDAAHKLRPLGRDGRRVLMTYKGFAEMEWKLGPGGQLHSFEAVFSPRGADGKPLLVFDRRTGAVDAGVVKTWQPYDIRLLLQQRWPKIGPSLAGKLHIIVGDEDTFYLDGAVRKLAVTLKELGSDAEVVIVPGADHGGVVFSEAGRGRFVAMASRYAATSRPSAE